MADAVLYTSQDQGAPVLNYTVNGISNFFELITKCLITGYGEGVGRKEGQGWEVVHSDLPKGFKLKTPDGVFYTFMYGTGQKSYPQAPSFHVYMSESLTDLSAYPPTGDNVRSGSYASSNPSDRRLYISCNSTGTVKPDTWFMAARGSNFYFSSSCDQAVNATYGYGPTHASMNSYYGFELFFGPILHVDESIPKEGIQNHVLLGGYEYTESYSMSSEICGSNLSSTSKSRIRLRSPLTGLVELGDLPSFGAAANLLSEDNNSKMPVARIPPELGLLRRPYVEDSLGFVGHLPGLFVSPYYTNRQPSGVLERLGRSIAFASYLEPVVIGSEEFYLVPTTYGCSFISLSEKYWI